jgi:hypothetical protein
MAELIKGIVKNRIDTGNNLISGNKTPLSGEVVIESDSKMVKIGDGATPYPLLPHIQTEIVKASITEMRSCGIMVPAYVYPTDVFNNTAFKTVINYIKHNESIPFVFIVNPGSGPGTTVDLNYYNLIELLLGAGAYAIGYVSTAYGGRDIDLVKADLDKWRELYPNVSGIFFDEMPSITTPALTTYYSDINRKAKGLEFDLTVLNPGTSFDKEFVRKDCADIFVAWENSVMPTESEAEDYVLGGQCEIPKSRRSILLHSQGAWSEPSFQMLANYYGWLYITEDLLSPNPWDTFSAYLPDMIAGIKSRK